ncbi:hypothetical protein F0562_010278 [Nyssa sinensis]|uniref:Uncharacterized protein n=1 Tax=Nyssa sinensis TaxID=561372 RepID=A0A5J4ZYF2_9ASTE|nr:hypothetical protein F0562_010278 [Nyssa sinensis]
MLFMVDHGLKNGWQWDKVSGKASYSLFSFLWKLFTLCEPSFLLSLPGENRCVAINAYDYSARCLLC